MILKVQKNLVKYEYFVLELLTFATPCVSEIVAVQIVQQIRLKGPSYVSELQTVLN